MSLYDRASSTAKQMIGKYGRDLVLKRNIEGTFDPATYAFSGTSSPEVSCKGIVTNFKINEVDGTIVLRTDKKIILDADALPEQNDKIIDGTDEYTIVNVDSLEPGNTTLLYKVQARR
jgi:hypothetical protein